MTQPSHFEHCYVYVGSDCSCSTPAGTYRGDRPGPTATCGRTDPHIAHRAWATPDVGICPGIPTTEDAR
ncbi:hypothetical protein [Kitasatospora griseola]|uniref:hypothetical protein n=1 Tax=Kitasatospora griseola TaxID=2064 RepID=UPI003659F36C